MTDNKMIVTEGLHKYFGKLHVLKGINESISQGEVVSIIGPSGSGKKHLLAVLEPPGDPRGGEDFL